MNEFLKAALWYARRGWPVLPVMPRAKQPPLVKNGLLDATTDLRLIEEWWTKNPYANVALRTGIWNFVLDIDRAKGGFETLEQLESKHGRLRRTLSQVTGGNGYQYLYRPPEQAVIHNAQDVCGWKGIDVRGENGYIIAPPSVHPSGGLYVWDGLNWDQEDVAEADAWLLEALLGTSNGHRGNGSGPYSAPQEKIREGNRHRELFKLACSLRGKGLTEAEILAAVWQFNVDRCEPPKTRDEIEKLVHDVAGRYTAGAAHAPAPEREPMTMPQSYGTAAVKALEVDPPEILVEGLLPRRGLTLFTGGQKMGKTILGAQAAVAIAMGHALLGYYQVEKPGPVIIVETDDPAGNASFKDLLIKWDVPDSAPMLLFFKAPCPLGEDFTAWIEGVIRDIRPVYVLLDSYLSLRPIRRSGGDVVATEKQEIADLDALAKRTSSNVLLLHHESSTTKANSLLGWDSRGAGTYAITAAAESQLSISRFKELDSSPVRLVQARGRHMAEHQMCVTYDVHSGGFSLLIDGPASIHYPLIREIRRSVQTSTFGYPEMIEALGVSKATACRQLAHLRDSGAVVVERYGEYRFLPHIQKMPV